MQTEKKLKDSMVMTSFNDLIKSFG